MEKKEKKAIRVNRLWISRIEENTFHEIKTIVPRLPYSFKDGIVHGVDIGENCDPEFKDHQSRVDMLNRMQRSCEGKYEIPENFN